MTGDGCQYLRRNCCGRVGRGQTGVMRAAAGQGSRPVSGPARLTSSKPLPKCWRRLRQKEIEMTEPSSVQHWIGRGMGRLGRDIEQHRSGDRTRHRHLLRGRRRHRAGGDRQPPRAVSPTARGGSTRCCARLRSAIWPIPTQTASMTSWTPCAARTASCCRKPPSRRIFIPRALQFAAGLAQVLSRPGVWLTPRPDGRRCRFANRSEWQG